MNFSVSHVLGVAVHHGDGGGVGAPRAERRTRSVRGIGGRALNPQRRNARILVLGRRTRDVSLVCVRTVLRRLIGASAVFRLRVVADALSRIVRIGVVIGPRVVAGPCVVAGALRGIVRIGVVIGRASRVAVGILVGRAVIALDGLLRIGAIVGPGARIGALPVRRRIRVVGSGTVPGTRRSNANVRRAASGQAGLSFGGRAALGRNRNPRPGGDRAKAGSRFVLLAINLAGALPFRRFVPALFRCPRSSRIRRTRLGNGPNSGHGRRQHHGYRR